MVYVWALSARKGAFLQDKRQKTGGVKLPQKAWAFPLRILTVMLWGRASNLEATQDGAGNVTLHGTLEGIRAGIGLSVTGRQLQSALAWLAASGYISAYTWNKGGSYRATLGRSHLLDFIPKDVK